MKRLLVASSCGLLAVVVAIGVFWHRNIDAEIYPNEPLMVGETTRHYRIVVPHKLPKSAPIVFAFHGIGDSTESMARYSQLDRLASRKGFILVYPAARKSMWATLDGNTETLDDNPDVRFFDQLLNDLPNHYNIDRERVYLVGMSNDASFVELLANARAGAVAALVAHSGSRPRNLVLSDNPRPVMLLVGQNDSEFAAICVDADQYRSVGRVVEFISIPGLAHEWSVRHDADMWNFLSQHTNRAF